MKEILLKEITLSDWKGQNRNAKFGNINEIKGRNASGKTTLMKAWAWLLTGFSDAVTNKNSDIFDNTKEITKDTPTASVKAVITINGIEYTLERTAKAKFVRKRGTDEYEKHPSDEYKYFVDEVEYSATQWDAWLEANIASSDDLKFALNGDFFVNLVFNKKDKARSLIESLFGQFDENEMKGDYKEIKNLMSEKDMTLQQIEEMAKAKIKKLNESIERVPIEISKTEELLSNLKSIDTAVINKEIEKLEKRRDELSKQMLDITEREKPILDAIHKAKMEIVAKQDIYDKAKTEYEQYYIGRDNELVKMISDAEASNNARAKSINTLQNEKVKLNAQQKMLNDTLARLREQRDAIKAETEAKCPLCGGVVTDTETLDKLKAERYNQVIFEGNVALKELKECEEQIAYIETRLQDLPKEVDVEPLKEKLSELRKMDILPFEETEQGVKLQEDIKAVVVPKHEIPNVQALQDEQRNIADRLRELYQSIPNPSYINQLENDIVELQKQQREMGAELGKCELLRMKVKEYNQERMDILSRQVNTNLKFSRLDIWSVQKDGQIIPDLVIKNNDGVSYATANNASRIMTTVDIQLMFCNKFGISLPVWIDEATILDSYHLPKIKDTQMFYILCSDDDLTIKSK